MNGMIIVFLTTLAALYFMFVAMSKEEGFLFSTKRMGWVLMILMVIVQIGILFAQADEKQKLLRAIVEHDITLPPIFETQVYDTKLELETEKIKEQLNANNKK